MDLLAPFRLAELANVDVDSADLVSRHRRILATKPLLQGVFREFYDLCKELERRHFTPAPGLSIEVGSGSSLFRKYYPDVLATDLKPCEGHDRQLNAMDMDLGPETVRSFFLINVFHHLPNPEEFFRQAERTLLPGGGFVVIDCYYGPFAAWFYRRLFATETFDPNQVEWTRSDRAAMSFANQALSYIVLHRDAERFHRLFPAFEVVERRVLHSYLRYLASGGLNFRPLVPSAFEGALRGMEWALTPFERALALHHVIALRKRL